MNRTANRTLHPPFRASARADRTLAAFRTHPSRDETVAVDGDLQQTLAGLMPERLSTRRHSLRVTPSAQATVGFPPVLH